MPNPTIYDLWRGVPATTDQPGAYRILRSLSADDQGWTDVQITDADMAAASDGTAMSGSADTDAAILRMVSIINPDVAGDVQVGINVVNGVLSPANAYLTAFSKGPGIELRFPYGLGMTSIFVKATAASVDYEAEFWYDIPPDAP